MDESPESLPEPTVRKRRGPSLVWLLPAVIALVGAWLSVKAYRETGPSITISFPSGEGIEAGQTRLKHKDVEIGKVRAVALGPGHREVIVTADLKREATELLSEHSRFWVVRARIGTTGISGLSTLLSGAYIAMDPGAPGTASPRAFKGLDAPSLDAIREPGTLVTLRAEKLGSLNLGSPVQFRQVRVGEVAAVDLAPDGKSVAIKAFIRAPYDGLVRKDTRFWDAGSVDVSLDANGLRMRSDSMLDLLLGAIAFENPVSLEASGPAPAGHTFTLFPNHDAVYEQVLQERIYFVLNFNESVRGLSRGAPVEFQGIRVGQVEDFKLAFNPETLDGKVQVLVALDPQRIFNGARRAGAPGLLDRLVKRGLRAQLRPASLLTGGLFVNLAFHAGAPAAASAAQAGYPEIPTVPSATTALIENLTRFLDRLQALPLEDLLQELRTSLPALREVLAQARATLARLETKSLPQAEAALAQAQATLADLEKLVQADSPTQKELRHALDEFAKAAKSVKDLADLLERRPQSLIFGKKKAK